MPEHSDLLDKQVNGNSQTSENWRPEQRKLKLTDTTNQK